MWPFLKWDAAKKFQAGYVLETLPQTERFAFQRWLEEAQPCPSAFGGWEW